MEDSGLSLEELWVWVSGGADDQGEGTLRGKRTVSAKETNLWLDWARPK